MREIRLRAPAVLLAGLIALATMVTAAPSVGAAKGEFVPLKKRITQPWLISGTFDGRSNTTEPRTVESRYLRVDSAGVILIERGAGFYIAAGVREQPSSTLYMRITYPNPQQPDQPLVNDAEFKPENDGFKLSSPDVIRGLAGYADYDILIEIFEDKTAQRKLDSLVQPVRCYVDTRTDQLLIWSGLAPVR